MRLGVVLILSIISVIGCGRGFQARSSSSQAANQNAEASDASEFEFDFNFHRPPPPIPDVDDIEPVPQPMPEPAPQPTVVPSEPAQPQPQPTVAPTPAEPPTPPPVPPAPQPPAPQPPAPPSPRPKVGFEGRVKPSTAVQSDFEGPGRVKPTLYYLVKNDVPLYRHCDENDTRSFRARDNKELLPGMKEIKVCRKFYFKVQMEGSGIIKMNDGTEHLINYAGVQLAIPRFVIVDRNRCPYGLGKKNLCLQPFISIAADDTKYQLGDVIYIPQVAQAKIRLPDGDTHLGFFIIIDSGSAINGFGRFDFFTGPIPFKDKSNPFSKLGMMSKSTSNLEYYRIKRDSQTARAVHAYYARRQIIPYNN